MTERALLACAALSAIPACRLLPETLRNLASEIRDNPDELKTSVVPPRREEFARFDYYAGFVRTAWISILDEDDNHYFSSALLHFLVLYRSLPVIFPTLLDLRLTVETDAELHSCGALLAESLTTLDFAYLGKKPRMLIAFLCLLQERTPALSNLRVRGTVMMDPIAISGVMSVLEVLRSRLSYASFDVFEDGFDAQRYAEELREYWLLPTITVAEESVGRHKLTSLRALSLSGTYDSCLYIVSQAEWTSLDRLTITCLYPGSSSWIQRFSNAVGTTMPVLTSYELKILNRLNDDQPDINIAPYDMLPGIDCPSLSELVIDTVPDGSIYAPASDSIQSKPWADADISRICQRWTGLAYLALTGSVGAVSLWGLVTLTNGCRALKYLQLGVHLVGEAWVPGTCEPSVVLRSAVFQPYSKLENDDAAAAFIASLWPCVHVKVASKAKNWVRFCKKVRHLQKEGKAEISNASRGEGVDRG